MKESLWKNGVTLPSFPSLEGDLKTDVLVIGGGITGLLTAFHLDKAGVNYLLVEKETIACGVTANTTAKITFQHGLLYHKILQRYGEKYAQSVLNANRIAFSKLIRLCQNIDCDFRTYDNYVYSLDDRRSLENEKLALERIGYFPELVTNPSLPFETAGAIRFRDQAQFHPLKFLATISQGLHIREHTRVTEMIGNTAVTEHGRIEAKKVIVATHFPFINKHGLYPLKLYQHRSYVIALENAPEMNGMYVDEDDKGLSFRPEGSLLLLGGGGHRTGKKGGSWNELHEFARKHFPHTTVRYEWATQDCMSLDSMPYIGKYGKHTEELFVASGFNKWGMTNAMLSALILTDLITEKENVCASLFDPGRSMLTAQLAINSAEAVIGLLTPTAKRCPHLKCALKWNKEEHTWDCSCHGSRFERNGKLINNPANNDVDLT